MTGRRLILAACVAVAALGATWWLWPDPLSPEERLMVGVWRTHWGTPKKPRTMEFTADGRLRGCFRDTPTGPAYDRWRIRDGRLEVTIYAGSDPIRLAIHRLAVAIGIGRKPPDPFVSVAADEAVLDYPGWKRYVWTRVPAE